MKALTKLTDDTALKINVEPGKLVIQISKLSPHSFSIRRGVGHATELIFETEAFTNIREECLVAIKEVLEEAVLVCKPRYENKVEIWTPQFVSKIIEALRKSDVVYTSRILYGG